MKRSIKSRSFFNDLQIKLLIIKEKTCIELAGNKNVNKFHAREKLNQQLTTPRLRDRTMSRIGKLIFNADEEYCSFTLNCVNFSGE